MPANLAITDIHKNAALSNISIAYSNAEYIAEAVAPTVMVEKESDLYYTFGKDNFRLEETVKGAKSRANRASYSMSTATYNCVAHALEDVVAARELSNADAALNIMSDTVENLTDKLLIRREKDTADTIFSTANAGTAAALSGGNKWDVNTSSSPILCVASASAIIASSIGRKPNTVIMGAEVFQGIQNNDELADRIKYTQTGIITTDLLAALFNVDQVLVGNAVYNSATEGQSDSMSYIWGKKVAIAYIERNPGLRRPSLAYTFKTQDRVVDTRPALDIDQGSMWVRVTDIYDDKLVDGNCMYILDSVVS
jgi:hypothetical protein